MSTNSPSWDQAVLQPPACDAWKEHMEGAAYHLASCIVLLGYMGGSGIFGSLYIFGLLAPGYFCYALWGWLSACGLDILVWNVLLVLICVLQLAHLAYRLRRDSVPEEFELLYKAMYLPLQVPLEVYREIVKCCEEQVQSLGRDQNYAVEGKTPIDRLSLLLSGRVRVSQDGQFLHYVFPYQFLDSPEWESLRPSEEGTFQVTLTAETDCSYITWPRRRLYLLLRKDRYIARLFSSHLGYDISEKLYSLNEKLFAKFGLRFDIRLPSLYHVLGPASSEGELEEAEELPCSPQPDHGLDGALEPPPQPPPPPPPASRPRSSRPESDLLGEDSTSLVLEDFAELPGSFMDYPLRTSGATFLLPAKDELPWLPRRPPSSREQQAVWIPSPPGGVCVLTLF